MNPVTLSARTWPTGHGGGPSLPDRGPAWMSDPQRGCAPEHLRSLFYSAQDSSQNRARRICASCPFERKCLTWAIGNDERHGVWGQVLMSSPDERRQASTNLMRAVAA